LLKFNEERECLSLLFQLVTELGCQVVASEGFSGKPVDLLTLVLELGGQRIGIADVCHATLRLAEDTEDTRPVERLYLPAHPRDFDA